MPTRDTDQPIRVLHLSDVHFKVSKAWDQDPVLRALARHIGDEVKKGLTPDLVVITGDLAHSGIGEEYALARDWLENQLWPALPTDLPRDRLLLVPGNHDVDRSKVGRIARLSQNDLLEKRRQDEIAKVLSDDEERRILLERHAAYLDFVSEWLGEPQPLPWWQRVIEIRGSRLHVAGLDSAWMACGEEDRGNLLLGRYQLTQSVMTGQAEAADWRIALLHHPWDYLAEFDGDNARAAVHQHCDLLLRGHLHKPRPERVLPPDPARGCLELPTGCVYETSQYPNAFQWIELSPADKHVRVLFRAWLHNAWTIDRNQPGCSDGHADFDLGGGTPAPKGKKEEPPPADFRKYLDDLWADTAHIDIRGLVTGRPEAHRVPIEDLYIELNATGSESGEPDRETRAGRSDTPLKGALNNPRLVIIGDPGCGKTTFLRWLAHCLSGDRLGRDSGAARAHLGLEQARLPILVPIADWLDFVERTEAQKNGPTLGKGADWLPRYLGTRAADANQGVVTADFRRRLRDGDCLILLDGLDEAPDYLQRQRAVGLIERLAQAYPDCPLVVTSRPAAYRDKAVLTGFAHTHIDALDTLAIDGFLTRWSRALFPERKDKAESHRKELAAALASRLEIRRMAHNTVMLTALAVVHWNEKRLPEQRAELYESILKWLIEAREQRPGREKTQRCRQLLAELALAMQCGEKGRQVQVARRWAAERLAARFGADPESTDRAEGFLAEEEIDSGIVVRRGHQLRFWHLTFQEYLAAQALAGRQDAERTRLLLEPTDELTAAIYHPEWRETVLLLGGVLYLQGEDKVDGLLGGILGRLGDSPTRAEQARAAGLLGALVRDLEPFGYRPADPRYGTLLEAAMAVFDPRQAPSIPIQDRIAAADALAVAGDPRLGWASPGRWVGLSGGRFSMGAQKKDPKALGHDPKASDAEAPVHAVIVDPFRIARFPVTVAEFAEFLEDEDHADPCWWQAGGGDEAAAPDDWEDQQSYPSRPVVKVSWYQAMAFCAWLTARLARPQGARGEIPLPAGRVVRLPTEAEWEYAARGEQARRYPWGGEEPDAQRANLHETNIGHPTPVGIFPGGVTPEGVVDMGGNVWEWTEDCWHDSYDGAPADGRAWHEENGGDCGRRVLRGGSWSFGQVDARSALRVGSDPNYRSYLIGFRVVCSSPSSGTEP